MGRVLLLIITLSAVVRGINSTHASGDNGSGDDRMSNCDPNDHPLCQPINFTTPIIHIELVLSVDCGSETVRNNIQCDIDEVLKALLVDAPEMTSIVIPCTVIEETEMDCRAMITVLDNSTVSQSLTRQLFDRLANNRTLVMYTSIHLMNAVDSASSDDDDLILNLNLLEIIIILIVIMMAIIGFCITFGLMFRCVRRKRQPAAKQVQSSRRKTPVQGVADLNYTSLEATDSSPFSPGSYEMNTFYPAGKKNDTVLTVQQLHDSIRDLPKLHEEFKSLPNKPTPANTTNGSSSDNQNKAQDNVPTLHSHVKLSSQHSTEELAPNSISANYIKGYNAVDRCYIVTHGPHQDNISDFWQMVWEQKPVAIAMLQQRDEGYIYWPDTSETLRQQFGLITVTVRKRTIKPEYIITTLRLFHAEENEENIDVEHYWYTKWTAEQLPTDTSGVIAFLQEINETRKSSEGPLLIHCSDGLSCSGTLVAIDIARQVLENNHTVDIANIVSNIRQDREGMVVTKEQYVYIYQVLSDWTEDILKLETSTDAEKTASTDHLVP